MIGGQPIPQGYYANPAPQSRPGLLPQLRGQAAATRTPSKQTSGAARVRLQGEDESATAGARRELPPLKMPSPEQVGLSGRRAELDWTAVKQRMDAARVTTFHLQKLDGGFRFTCVVPAGGERRKIEADGLTEAEAVDLALTRAEQVR